MKTLARLLKRFRLAVWPPTLTYADARRIVERHNLGSAFAVKQMKDGVVAKCWLFRVANESGEKIFTAEGFAGRDWYLPGSYADIELVKADALIDAVIAWNPPDLYEDPK